MADESEALTIRRHTYERYTYATSIEFVRTRPEGSLAKLVR